MTGSSNRYTGGGCPPVVYLIKNNTKQENVKMKNEEMKKQVEEFYNRRAMKGQTIGQILNAMLKVHGIK